jgi:hypothetical protein
MLPPMESPGLLQKLRSHVSRWPVARVGSKDKIVDSKVLNLAGAQVLRMVAAHTLHRFARSSAPPADLAAACQELQTRGYLRIDNFFPPEVFAQLRSAAHDALEDDQSCRNVYDQGATECEHIYINKLPPAAAQRLEAWVNDVRTRTIAGWAMGRPLGPDDCSWVIEQVTHGVRTGRDYEADLHMDVFYPSFKAWLYLEPVPMEHGPFVYVPSSQALTLERIRWEYRNSIGDRHGSRRVTPEEMSTRGLAEQVFDVPANTLVMANTCGYHRRTPGLPGKRRRALLVNFRAHPFPRRLTPAAGVESVT